MLPAEKSAGSSLIVKIIKLKQPAHFIGGLAVSSIN